MRPGKGTKNDDPPTPKPDVPDPGPDVLKNERVHSTPSVGRKGRQFYRKFIFKSFPFYRNMSIKRKYAISRVGFPTNDCIV